jgi:hypothetical protein
LVVTPMKERHVFDPGCAGFVGVIASWLGSGRAQGEDGDMWVMGCHGDPSPTAVDILSLGARIPFVLLIRMSIDSMRSRRAFWL